MKIGGINVKTALQYPFEKGRLKPLILWPTALFAAATIIYLILYFVVTFFSAFLSAIFLSSNEGVYSVGFIILYSFGMLIVMLLSGTLFSPILGFYWELFNRWHQDGFDAALPEWSSASMKQFAKHGFKAMLPYIALQFIGILCYLVPYIGLASLFHINISDSEDISSGLLSLSLSGTFSIISLLLYPFMIALYAQSARSKTLKELFNFPRALRLGTAAYLPVALALFISFIVSLLYSIPMFISFCTIIGPLVVYSILTPTMLHLVAQAFLNSPEGRAILDETPEQPRQIAPPINDDDLTESLDAGFQHAPSNVISAALPTQPPVPLLPLQTEGEGEGEGKEPAQTPQETEIKDTTKEPSAPEAILSEPKAAATSEKTHQTVSQPPLTLSSEETEALKDIRDTTPERTEAAEAEPDTPTPAFENPLDDLRD